MFKQSRINKKIPGIFEKHHLLALPPGFPTDSIKNRKDYNRKHTSYFLVYRVVDGLCSELKIE